MPVVGQYSCVCVLRFLSLYARPLEITQIFPDHSIRLTLALKSLPLYHDLHNTLFSLTNRNNICTRFVGLILEYASRK